MFFKLTFIVKWPYGDVIMLTCHALGAFALVALPKASVRNFSLYSWVRNFKQHKLEGMVILISFPTFMLNSLSSIIQLKQNHPGPTQKLFIGEQHLQKEKYVPLVEPCESFI